MKRRVPVATRALHYRRRSEAQHRRSERSHSRHSGRDSAFANGMTKAIGAWRGSARRGVRAHPAALGM